MAVAWGTIDRMIPLAAVLTLVAIGLAVASAVASREYHRAYAQAYRDVPPFVMWAFQRDSDPAVEGARRTANALSWAGCLCFVAAAILFVVGR